MRRNRNRFAQRDGNHEDFTRALMGCGLSVFDTSAVKDGFPDIVVGGYSHRTGRNETILVEIKAHGKLGDLTPAEVDFHDRWRGAAMVTEIADDVLRYFGLVD